MRRKCYPKCIVHFNRKMHPKFRNIKMGGGEGGKKTPWI